jgi:branched-chain amino acid transport system permease protein
VLAALLLFLRRTRYGLVIRAGVENRAMVSALGINVERAFTVVFTIGGIAAGLAGYLAGTYFGYVDPTRGTSMLIFAFIVVVIGGLGSVTGSAIAAAVVAIVQQFLNFYAAPGVGDFSVVILLAAALLLRPRSGESA